MPRRLSPLPPTLQDRAFTVAEARDAEVSRSRLDAHDLQRTSWGLRSPRRPGLDRREVEVLRGLRVTRPVSTWIDLAAVPAFSVEDIVIAGDAFATRDPELLTEFVRAGESTGGRGQRKVRAAAGLIRSGSGSPMETRARLAFGRAGIPDPELNATVHAEDGHFVARVDFLWREARVIVEYEGDQHRTDRKQWQNDIHRVRLLESLGWKVIRITATDVTDPRRRDELATLLRDLVG